jgi:electron transport complex protein RnfG
MSGERSSQGRKPGRVLPQAPKPKEVPSSRLLLTLGTAGVLAGVLIVFVYQATQPTIRAYKARLLKLAIEEVLKSPYRYDTLYVHEGVLTPELPAGADPRTAEKVFVGYNENGERVGFAITGVEGGFQDDIGLIFGYDPATHTVLGMKVLESRETPGLGDRIEKDQNFLKEFESVEAPLKGVKPGRATGAPNEVDLITGATISSRAVIRIINHRVEKLGPLLDAYLEGETRD